jgi:hypothetical protein
VEVYVKPSIQKAIWILWALVVPLGLWLISLYFPPHIAGLELDLLGFVALALIGAAMPMVINNTPISIIQCWLLAVFLAFGIFIEILVAQIAIIVLLLRLRIGKKGSFRFPLNSIMFFLISLISGLLYYVLGGTTGVNLISNASNLWFAIVYSIVHFIVNQIILSVNFRLVYQKKRTLFGQDFIWDLTTAIISLPIGYSLYILYTAVGEIAFLFVGVPFVSLSIILYLYYSSQKINEYLHHAADIGHQLAERLQVDEVLDLFIQKVSEMLPVDYAYILEVIEGEELQLLRRVEKGEILPPDIAPLKKNEGISGYVWANRKAALFHSAKKWQKYAKGYMPPEAQS